MPEQVNPEDDRHNGLIYTACYIFIYLAAPVLYVGVVQAALCDKLGASATLANLPASTYMLGQVAPLIFSWLVPHRLERSMVVWANLGTATFAFLVFLALTLPLPDGLRIAAVVLQALLQGLSVSSSMVFMLQCLKRGTTQKGLARALQQTYGIGPIFAVAGSLGAQFVLNPGLPGLAFPRDFALIYLFAVPCALGIAYSASRFRLPPLADEPRAPLFEFLSGSLGGFAGNRALLLAGAAYLLWYMALGITSNLSLFTRQAMGRDPAEFSGFIMVIRFGTKALAGFALGWIALRAGLRGGVIGCTSLLIAGCVWAWIVPGAPFLFAFGLLGAGELGGTYFPNYVGSLSSATQSTRNFAILTLATPLSSFAPVLYGALTDRYGFPASFALAIAAAAGALLLVSRQASAPAAKPASL